MHPDDLPVFLDGFDQAGDHRFASLIHDTVTPIEAGGGSASIIATAPRVEHSPWPGRSSRRSRSAGSSGMSYPP